MVIKTNLKPLHNSQLKILNLLAKVERVTITLDTNKMGVEAEGKEVEVEVPENK